LLVGQRLGEIKEKVVMEKVVMEYACGDVGLGDELSHWSRPRDDAVMKTMQ
jgi:hypothetical protein